MAGEAQILRLALKRFLQGRGERAIEDAASHARDFGVRTAPEALPRNLFGEVEEPLTVYHGTYGAFSPDEILPWSHFGTENAARHRLRVTKTTPPTPDIAASNPDRILPFELQGRIANIGAEPNGNFSSTTNISDMEHIADGLLRGGHISRNDYLYIKEPIGPGYNSEHVRNLVRQRMEEITARNDIDAIGYTNGVEDSGSTSYIIPNPRTALRPTFPLFGAAIGVGGGMTLREILADKYAGAS